MIEQVPLPYDGGTFTVKTRRCVVHSTEGSTIEGAVAAYRAQGFCPHLTWDPTTGRIVQHLPFDIAASTLAHKGDPHTNRLGAIQIEVVGYARVPFTDGPCVGLDEIVALIDQLGVPRVWPAGPPLPYPQSYGAGNGQRDPWLWSNVPGWYAHSQIPGNDHGDPGPIDIARILNAGGAPVIVPTEKEEDMRILTVGRTSWLLCGGKARPIANGTDYAALRASGVEEAKVSQATVDPWL